jgi:anti-repressor protein
MTDLQLFMPPPDAVAERGYQLQVIMRNGDPWFIGRDVAAMLGLGNPRSSLALLDDDERDVHSMDTPSGQQKYAVINESGLYSLILRSRRPEARLFKKWITSQVLPEIRQTGSYGVQRALSPRELAQMVIEAEDRADAVTAELEAARPAIEAHAAYMDAEGLCDMATAAAALKIGRNSLFVELRRAGVLISTAGAQYNTPKARYKRVPHGLGWFEIKTGTRERSSGELEATYTTMVTSKGIEGIRKLLVL